MGKENQLRIDVQKIGAQQKIEKPRRNVFCLVAFIP